VHPEPTPLTLGTLLARIDAGAFTVTRSTYAPAQRLPAHSHELASVTVVLRGSVAERVEGRRFSCDRDRLLLRPAAVVHSNVYGDAGAECVIIGAKSDWVATDAIARAVFGAPTLALAPTSRVLGERMRRELGIGDAASTLAIEGLALELIASAARLLRDPRGRAAPPWLRAIQERLHDDYATTIRLHVVAHEAGVHPVYLTRAFRRCFGCSPGEYVRQRRIDWACEELSATSRSITEIALGAGFASPSHFATAFRRAVGVSPRDYRAARVSTRFKTLKS
jgi:AraC family transcriptional regulator